MEWSDTKYLFSISKLLRDYLYDYGEHLKPEYCTRDKEYCESICHHRHDRESRTEREWADISHVELCRLDIEPEKSYQRSAYDQAECWEDREPLIVADKCVYRIVKKKQSSCETIEPVSDIDAIGHRRDDEDEEGDIPDSEIDISKEGYTDIGVPELEEEPVGSERSEEKEEYELHSSWEPLRPSDLSDIEIVIDESYPSYCEEREECEIRLFSI